MYSAATCCSVAWKASAKMKGPRGGHPAARPRSCQPTAGRSLSLSRARARTRVCCLVVDRVRCGLSLCVEWWISSVCRGRVVICVRDREIIMRYTGVKHGTRQRPITGVARRKSRGENISPTLINYNRYSAKQRGPQKTCQNHDAAGPRYTLTD